MNLRNYVLSLPERVLRSATGLAAGIVREVAEVALPAALQRTRLYQNIVANTLRFLIEQVGEVKDAYPAETALASDFAVRRAAGNGIELVGILAFRASPVWVMAALADVSGAGRHLVREISAELRANGLLEPETEFSTMDQLLEGLERFSARTADTINTPPLDVAALRRDWAAIRREALSLPAPAIGSIEALWRDLKAEAQAQDRSVFALSSVMALSALRDVPGGVRWLGRSATLAAWRTGEILGDSLLGHYRRTLEEIHRTGYLAYWVREYKPYVRAAAAQFSPRKRSLTERLLTR